MDGDIENVSKLIYPEGLPSNWIDNPDYYQYLSKIGGYSIEQLCKEPSHIQAEKAAVLHQTQDLAFANYKTFIHTAECSREIFREFEGTEKRLDSLLTKMPEFSSSCSDFLKEAEEIKLRRRMNSVSLSKHSQILQLLEIPQLIETVIKEGMYNEALRLSAYVRRLAKNQPNIPIIEGLLREVDSLWVVLFERLVSELSSDLLLPRCLQVVGHIRRMEVLSELELRLKFLQSRDTYLNSLLSAIPCKDPSQHLMKTIEVSRSQLFNIITQYRAVFSQDDTFPANHLSDFPLLQSWINAKVMDFLRVLENDLGSCLETNVESVIGQVMYFGQSLGRVGCDLRVLTVPIIRQVMGARLDAQLHDAITLFASLMDKFSLTHSLQTSGGVSGGVGGVSGGEEGATEAPPSSLLEFYPLSRLANSYTACLNQLRLCAPLSLAHKLTSSTNSTFTAASNSILHYFKREQQAMTPEERESFTRLVIVYSDHFLPYVQRCIHVVFPPLEIANHLSVPIQKLQAEGLTFIDTIGILRPLDHLIPVRLDTSFITQTPLPVPTPS